MDDVGGGVCPTAKMVSRTIREVKIVGEFVLHFAPFSVYTDSSHSENR